MQNLRASGEGKKKKKKKMSHDAHRVIIENTTIGNVYIERGRRE